MRYIFFLASLWFMLAAGMGFGQQANDAPDVNVTFKEQQRQLNDQLIDNTVQQVKILNSMRDFVGKEQFDSAWDYAPDITQFQQQMRRYRGDDEFNYSRARLDNLKLRSMEAESKKNELKARVLDYNKRLPEWWDKEEVEFIEKRRQAVQSGLRR